MPTAPNSGLRISPLFKQAASRESSMQYLVGIVLSVSAAVLDFSATGWMDPSDVSLSPKVIWSGYPRDFALDHYISSSPALSSVQLKHGIAFHIMQTGYWWSQSEPLSPAVFCNRTCVLQADRVIKKNYTSHYFSLQYRWRKILNVNHLPLAWDMAASTPIFCPIALKAYGTFCLSFKQLNWKVSGYIFNTSSSTMLSKKEVIFPLITQNGFLDGIIGETFILPEKILD
ncbi:hypothetical protein DSO57_1016023 [Entomophthora muscae]|uniref:Uncharacterized protein n=1 Tax=Entomophthora muscae TaxID=34485 RepID=A0ACC2TFY0_9FUNG|nr:hypothetical protein DSO57_1016023 [Entomophthora muscae]